MTTGYISVPVSIIFNPYVSIPTNLLALPASKLAHSHIHHSISWVADSHIPVISLLNPPLTCLYPTWGVKTPYSCWTLTSIM